MSSMSAAFLSGMGVGLAVAVPIGPMGILCIQRTLIFGAVAGVATGLGAATVHATFSAGAILGLAPTLRAVLDGSSGLVSAFSACLLFWFAARIIGRTVVLTSGSPTCQGLSASYFSAVACALLNPLTLILFAAVLPAFAVTDETAAPLVIAGVLAGSVVWWIILSSIIALLRSRLNIAVLNAANKASGFALATLGVLMVADVFGFNL
jgi:threonine/homoserine/homoserine lactone efflux protein